MWLGGNTDTVLYNAPYTSILKRKFLVDFLTWVLLWESCSRQPGPWMKNLPFTSRENSYLHFFFTQKFQYRRPFRNHIYHCPCWETWTDSATSILGTVVASTNLCRAGFQAILPCESFLDSCVLKAFSLRSAGKKWKGEFGSKHTGLQNTTAILLWCGMM